MPLPHSVSVHQFTPDGEEKEEVNLAQELKFSTQNGVEWAELWLGKDPRQMGPVRLVAFRFSPESAARKRQGLTEAMRTHGNVPSDKALQLAGWLLLRTNAPVQELPSSMISYLYRMRRQVELIFRQTKSVLRLDKTESKDPHRVQCEIWARLISAVLLFLWHAHANVHCWLQQQRESSFEKLIWMMQQWGLTRARAFLGPERQLLELIRTLWKQLLHNGRKGCERSRPTSWENLFDLWLNAMGSFTCTVPFRRDVAVDIRGRCHSVCGLTPATRCRRWD